MKSIPSISETWHPRPATLAEAPVLHDLITLSVETLQAAHYTEAQRRAAMGPVFGVDLQLISDGTYFVVEAPNGQIVGCGGWSKRASLFGGSAGRTEPEELVPGIDPARIRAFFVHPDYARRGIGRAILLACETAIINAGFPEAHMVATLPGVPLYASHGYQVIERYNVPLADGLELPVVRMGKVFPPSPGP